jgi:hypothetical protein
MTETVVELMEANLLEVFNERDAHRRSAAIERIYAPDVRWTDDEGIVVGHEALAAKAIALQSRTEGLVFTEASPVYQTRGLGYLAFELGPEGGDAVAAGFDVAVVRDDVISELYTVLTTQPDTNPQHRRLGRCRRHHAATTARLPRSHGALLPRRRLRQWLSPAALSSDGRRSESGCQCARARGGLSASPGNPLPRRLRRLPQRLSLARLRRRRGPENAGRAG